MPRPKQYADGAQKQAAYRARLKRTTVIVDRHALDLLNQRLAALREAVQAAGRAGDPTASKCGAGSPETVIDKLIQHFNHRSAPLAKTRDGLNDNDNTDSNQTRKLRKARNPR